MKERTKQIIYWIFLAQAIIFSWTSIILIVIREL